MGLALGLCSTEATFIAGGQELRLGKESNRWLRSCAFGARRFEALAGGWQGDVVAAVEL